MEDKLAVKENALEVLEKQLHNRAKKNQYGIIVLASATEPYLQIEQELRLTRQILELILKYRFPVHIITKSNLVVRDFDLLKEIDKTAILPEDLRGKLKHRVLITFSFSTIDHTVAKIFEPGATLPTLRFEALHSAVQEGFLSGVSMMPLLPEISDSEEELKKMFQAFKDAGAHYAMAASLTLFGDAPADSKALVLRAVQKHFPDKAELYQKLFERYSIDFNYQQKIDNRLKMIRSQCPIPEKIIFNFAD